MKKPSCGLIAAFLFAAAAGLAPGALAQSAETTEMAPAPAKTGWMSSFLGALGLSAPDKSLVSPSNIAGALQYCLQKKDVSGGAAATETALVDKTKESGTASSTAFQAGEQGTLEGSNGKTLRLDGNGLTTAIKDKACNAILQRAQALLG